MARELERVGIATAHVCTMVNVSKDMGGNRIVLSRSVLHPTGDPELPHDEEVELRKRIVDNALKSIYTEIEEARIFE